MNDCNEEENKDGLNYMDSVLLVTGVTFSLVRHTALTTGVAKANHPICMRTNMGTRNLKEYRILPIFSKPFWYDKNSMAKYLFLQN